MHHSLSVLSPFLRRLEGSGGHSGYALTPDGVCSPKKQKLGIFTGASLVCTRTFAFAFTDSRIVEPTDLGDFLKG